MERARKFFQTAVKTAPVVIFENDSDLDCAETKRVIYAILHSRGIEYDSVVLTLKLMRLRTYGRNLLRVIHEETSANSDPYVFIGGQYVGGRYYIQDLYYQGSLGLRIADAIDAARK